jgi:1,4-alpha-glucan branching enzyme
MPSIGGLKMKPMNKLPRKEKKVDFEYFAPQARTVSLAGTFNRWNTETCPLKKGRDGKWKVSLSLAPGRYEYRYFVDRVWENDQRTVECVPNAFGSWNCVITVQ